MSVAPCIRAPIHDDVGWLLTNSYSITWFMSCKSGAPLEHVVIVQQDNNQIFSTHNGTGMETLDCTCLPLWPLSPSRFVLYCVALPFLCGLLVCICWNCCYYCGIANEIHSGGGSPLYVCHIETYCDSKSLDYPELLFVMHPTFSRERWWIVMPIDFEIDYSHNVSLLVLHMADICIIWH